MVREIFTNVILRTIQYIESIQSLPEMMVHDINLNKDGATLKIYVSGTKHSKFRFIYEDNCNREVKVVRRAFSNKLRPMQELRTGIHDKTLSEFTNTKITLKR